MIFEGKNLNDRKIVSAKKDAFICQKVGDSNHELSATIVGVLQYCIMRETLWRMYIHGYIFMCGFVFVCMHNLLMCFTKKVLNAWHSDLSKSVL